MSRRRIVVALLVAVAAATLVSTGGTTRPFNVCITCGFRWLADWIANVAMFVPLGCAMNWKRRHIARTALFTAGFSTAIEFLQTVIPGRDPALGDILANSLGGAIGAVLGSRPSAWLTPVPRLADRLLTVAILVVVMVAGATRWVLSPASNLPPDSQLSHAVSALFRGEATVEFITISYPSSGETPLVLVGGPPPLEVLYIGRAASDAVFRYRSRARDLRLDAPEYPVPDFFEGVGESDSLRVQVSYRSLEWCLAWTLKRECGIGPTAGSGWAVLIYPYSFGRRWGRVIDGLWAAALFFPVGFWSRRRTVVIAVAALGLILGPLAHYATLVPTTFTEWCGALTGCVLGLALGIWLRRRHTFAVETT